MAHGIGTDKEETCNNYLFTINPQFLWDKIVHQNERIVVLTAHFLAWCKEVQAWWFKPIDGGDDWCWKCRWFGKFCLIDDKHKFTYLFFPSFLCKPHMVKAPTQFLTSWNTVRWLMSYNLVWNSSDLGFRILQSTHQIPCPPSVMHLWIAHTQQSKRCQLSQN